MPHIMTEEHKQKIKAARDAYWAQKRAEKAGMPQPGLSPKLNGTIYEPADGQVQVFEEKKVDISQARSKTTKRIFKKLDRLLDAQIDIATGYYYTNAKGDHIYQKQPNGSTGEYLLNQLIGKPKESIEVTSKNLNVDI